MTRTLPPEPTRRTGLNRTVLLRPGAPWHGARAGRVLGARGPVDPDQWWDALTHLLDTLTAPTPEDRRARSDWEDRDWDRWSRTRLLVLAGGVVERQLGLDGGDRRLERLTRRTATGGRVLQVAPRPAQASLTGLQAAGPVTGPTLLLDLGHTAVKALVAGPGGRAASTATRVPVPWQPFEVGTWPDEQTVLGLVRDAASRAWAEGSALVRAEPGSGTRSQPGAAPAAGAEVEVRVALANYLTRGRLDEDDTYGRLTRMGPDLATVLQEALRPVLPTRPRVAVLVNDGLAAALPWADQPGAAVISVGTSLGIGHIGSA